MTEPARRHRITADEGISLEVSEWGDATGAPLVILHGGAHRASSWAEVCSALPHTIRCIVPDQRGHGASDRSPSGDYSCAAQVRDLEALLDALSLERVALAGHSMGGLNALQFAGEHPERVSALVLFDVGTETREAGLERVQRPAPPPADSPPSPPGNSPPSPPADNPQFDIRLLDFVPTYCGDSDFRRRLLRAVDAPVLVVRGARSRILSAESAAATAELVGARVVEIPDSGHNVSLANPSAVAAQLREFLAPGSSARDERV